MTIAAADITQAVAPASTVVKSKGSTAKRSNGIPPSLRRADAHSVVDYRGFYKDYPGFIQCVTTATEFGTGRYLTQRILRLGREFPAMQPSAVTQRHDSFFLAERIH